MRKSIVAYQCITYCIPTEITKYPPRYDAYGGLGNPATTSRIYIMLAFWTAFWASATKVVTTIDNALDLAEQTTGEMRDTAFAQRAYARKQLEAQLKD